MHSNKQITRKTIAYLPSLRKRASTPGRLGWPRPAARPDQRLLWRRLGERTLTKVQKSLESCKPLSGGPEEHRPLRIFGGPLNTKILSTHGINEARLQRWTVTFIEPCFWRSRRRPLPSLATRIRRLGTFFCRSHMSTLATTSTPTTTNIPYKQSHAR